MTMYDEEFFKLRAAAYAAGERNVLAARRRAERYKAAGKFVLSHDEEDDADVVAAAQQLAEDALYHPYVGHDDFNAPLVDGEEKRALEVLRVAYRIAVQMVKDHSL